MKKDKENTSDLELYTVVECDLLRLREKASLESDILDMIPSGSLVDVYPNYPNKIFYKVFWNGKVGYCVKTFLAKR